MHIVLINTSTSFVSGEVSAVNQSYVLTGIDAVSRAELEVEGSYKVTKPYYLPRLLCLNGITEGTLRIYTESIT